MKIGLKFLFKCNTIYRTDLRFPLSTISKWLILVNIGVWIATAIAFRNFSLLGTAVIAYTLGLRHAVDADHLAAIDNVTRKLLQSGQHSVSVGLFFSLGHSTIVIIASIAIAITATAVKKKLGDLKAIGGLIGTSVSAAFLFIIGIVNCFLLVSILRSLRKFKRTGTLEEENIEDIFNNSGLLGRFFKPVFKFIDASWKMYPLGVLFGFGFDTSTEIGLLGIAAFQANQGLSIWLIMFFPLLFTSGMALIDTIDGILMLGTYTWAYINPIRKLYYNFVITLLSVLVAFVVGTIELLNILSDKLNLQGPFWNFFAKLGNEFGTIGYLIIGLFVFTWLIAIIIYKYGGYEKLVHKFDQKNIRNLDNNDLDIDNQDGNSKHSIDIVVNSENKRHSKGSIEVYDN
ncbi:HoxN/HupN/NixA family nickel/cobalt transporter [Rhizophagus clarus]|uniref:Nickel/cobalt efflux system n=1 Tax=Rhizophagus clarus TaxID=94130 RepID=A0A8H3MFG2_9GLOM|nr:HoxN/HupN/NixA family nickel/cobalt transporter [Rhizophagus clarus]